MVTLHVLSVSAIGFDGTRGDALTVTVGLGGELFGRLRISDHVAVDLRVLAEALVPPTRFLLHGETSVETGKASIGVGSGLVFGIP